MQHVKRRMPGTFYVTLHFPTRSNEEWVRTTRQTGQSTDHLMLTYQFHTLFSLKWNEKSVWKV